VLKEHLHPHRHARLYVHQCTIRTAKAAGPDLSAPTTREGPTGTVTRHQPRSKLCALGPITCWTDRLRAPALAALLHGWCCVLQHSLSSLQRLHEACPPLIPLPWRRCRCKRKRSPVLVRRATPP